MKSSVPYRIMIPEIAIFKFSFYTETETICLNLQA
jgi:hypothetical protein